MARIDEINFAFPSFEEKNQWRATGQFAESIHERRANITFCDGHVETLSFKSLFYDTDDAALRRWNKDHQPHR